MRPAQNNRPLWSVLPALVALMAAGVTGCGEAVDPALLAARDQYVVAEPPGDHMAISKIRGRIEREEVSPPVEVVVRGRIHAGEMPPWETGKAAFMLTDITGHEGETDHDPHTCPFCSEDIDAYLAKVMFKDESGVLPFDARELFDVAEKQIVTISGQAYIDSDGLLAVEADKMLIEREPRKAKPAVKSDDTTSADSSAEDGNAESSTSEDNSTAPDAAEPTPSGNDDP